MKNLTFPLLLLVLLAIVLCLTPAAEATHPRLGSAVFHGRTIVNIGGVPHAVLLDARGRPVLDTFGNVILQPINQAFVAPVPAVGLGYSSPLTVILNNGRRVTVVRDRFGRFIRVN